MKQLLSLLGAGVVGGAIAVAVTSSPTSLKVPSNSVSEPDVADSFTMSDSEARRDIARLKQQLARLNHEQQMARQFREDVTDDIETLSEVSEEGTTIKALVPEVEMQTYSQDLRSMTSGEGIYAMHLSHYEFMPPDKAQPLIDAYKKAREEGK